MGVLDRIVLGLYALVVAVCSLALFVVALGWTRPIELAASFLWSANGRLVCVLAAVVLLAASMRMLGFVLRRRRPVTIVQQTDAGEVRVSLAAVENLVYRVAVHQAGVRNAKASVRRDSAGRLKVTVRVTVSPDVSLPELTARLQQVVTEEIKSVIGVVPGSVGVAVEDFGDEARRGRMEHGA